MRDLGGRPAESAPYLPSISPSSAHMHVLDSNAELADCGRRIKQDSKRFEMVDCFFILELQF
ncbi:hypothetical protein LI328DRAFT_138243 [Trichoderma asperelloides]|nr:hypothetical protein LI328DRAFT_138243 [Trichoderma asperelloides]